MRIYNSNAGSETRIAYGTETIVGLRQFDETAPLAASFEPVNARLQTTFTARKDAERAQLQARVQVRFADWKFDQEARAAFRAAQTADGGKTGKITRALFPDGLNTVVIPSGPSQHAASVQLINRAKACTTSGAEKVLGEHLPSIEKASGDLKLALDERDRLAAARAVAFTAEEVARDDHEAAIDKLMGEVRALYPRDRKRWDLIFPTLPSRRARRDDDDEPTPEPSDVD